MVHGLTLRIHAPHFAAMLCPSELPRQFDTYHQSFMLYCFFAGLAYIYISQF